MKKYDFSKSHYRKCFITFFIVFATLTCYSQNVEKAQKTTIYDVQFTADVGGTSPMVYNTVTLKGIVTASFLYGFTIAEQEGPWHAIYVETFLVAPKIGDMVQVTGMVYENYDMTMIVNVVQAKIMDSDMIIEPITITVAEARQEKYESVLIKILDAFVWDLFNYGEWGITDDMAHSLTCDDINDFMYFPEIGDFYSSITGVLEYTYGDFKLEPRSTLDFESDAIPHYALKGNVVTMNSDFDFLEDHYIEIKGDRIIGITSESPGGLEIYETDGYIFPGLIDAHNHPHWNVMDLIPFEQKFVSRYEWRETELYGQFGAQFRSIRDYGGYNAQFTNLFKLAEVRALVSGTTTIEGYEVYEEDYNSFARQGIGINNAERFPNRIINDVFPLDPRDVHFWNFVKKISWDRNVIHLAEGIDQNALQEFRTWRGLGKVDEYTAIIHGVALGENELSQMAKAGSHLIWSPSSNVRLYGETADIPAAVTTGLNIALAPDWTESGTPDLLTELKFASWVNDTKWDGLLSERQLASFVTRNAALALGIEERYGSISAGMNADLCVIPSLDDDPYVSLVNAQPSDVILTVVNGRPMYGNPELIGQFTFLDNDDIEDISICGFEKQIALKIFAHAIEDSEKPLSQVMSELHEAYDASSPKICNFLGYDYCDTFDPLSDIISPENGGMKSTIINYDNPLQFSLEQNYPNPFDEKTFISFRLPCDSKVKLRIYNSSGQLIQTLEDNIKPSGRQSIQLNGNSYSPGIYFYQLEAQGIKDPSLYFSEVKRMTILK